ncbi:uncharacterized protein LOC132307193 [Cornus florida]|uniref:uncharacterized protein LOC132307193 n=1 Tax=Cornus florida TaxID=4283 RepID=UPI00289D3ECF|nr:uncharacterized protein LOC132307193 [Cornus florida]
MASTTRGKGGDVKGFYRQTKKSGGITKPRGKASSSSKGSSKASPNQSATFGSDIAQPPTLISHGSLDLNDEYDAKEEVLRQFDMNMAYGPCCGMSRLGRWERAQRMGLNPPKDIESLLNGPKVSQDCLWEGRV